MFLKNPYEMLKFLRKGNKQPVSSAENATGDDEDPTDDLPTVNYLEEVLKPLFEQIQPTAPEEYVGMYNWHALFVSVTVIHCSQVVHTRIRINRHISRSDIDKQHEHFPKTFAFFKERFKSFYTSSCSNCESC